LTRLAQATRERREGRLGRVGGRALQIGGRSIFEAPVPQTCARSHLAVRAVDAAASVQASIFFRFRVTFLARPHIHRRNKPHSMGKRWVGTVATYVNFVSESGEGGKPQVETVPVYLTGALPSLAGDLCSGFKKPPAIKIGRVFST